MSAITHLRTVAKSAGWELKHEVGSPTGYLNHTWDRDIFVIGTVHRNLADGTPVVEPAHQVEVWYRRDGAVRSAQGTVFTPERISHYGITSRRHERDKAERIASALLRHTAELP